MKARALRNGEREAAHLISAEQWFFVQGPVISVLTLHIFQVRNYGSGISVRSPFWCCASFRWESSEDNQILICHLIRIWFLNMVEFKLLILSAVNDAFLRLEISFRFDNDMRAVNDLEGPAEQSS
jgi:hypothetical protein